MNTNSLLFLIVMNMLNEIIEQTLMRMFIVRLSELRIDGSFLCPRCNNVISPDDEDEIYYMIEGVLFDETFEEIGAVILCKCGCRTLLDLNASFPEKDPLIRV